MTVKETAAFLRQHDNYLILTHKRPDGGHLGCAARLCEGLRGPGQDGVDLSPHGGDPPGSPPIWRADRPGGLEPGHRGIGGYRRPGLFPENARCYLERVDLAIDHHPPGVFCRETCLDAGRRPAGS